MPVVRLTDVKGTTINFSGVEMLDQTPLLDIEPFNPAVATHNEFTVGWLDSGEEQDQFQRRSKRT